MASRKAFASARGLSLAFVAALALGGSQPLVAQEDMPKADAALILSVDVSSSVDERRYHLQMEGIAAALEDDSVINTVLGGANGLFRLQFGGKALNKDEVASLMSRLRGEKIVSLAESAP